MDARPANAGMGGGIRGVVEESTYVVDFSTRLENDVLATMDTFGIERAALVGNSFGGAVALRVSAR
jgi:pimeloyl-ACP methyl ester carboxylesterase